jgi:opacity protein-like surface antigen
VARDGTCIEDDFGCSYTYKSHELTIGDSWAVTGRLGVHLDPRTLVYGLAGYSEAEISVHGHYDVDDDFSTPIDESGWRSGFVLGAGAETMLTQNVSLKGEYRFARYRGMDGSAGPGGGDYYQTLNADNPTVHSIRAVVSWRFVQ